MQWKRKYACQVLSRGIVADEPSVSHSHTYMHWVSELVVGWNEQRDTPSANGYFVCLSSFVVKLL